MKLTINFIDAFTDTVFKGNSAAVIITEDWLSDTLMQSIATENNLSETAFLIATGIRSYKIKWFSPITEIDFCGHATLSAAFVLFNQNQEYKELTFFADAVGEFTIIKKSGNEIQMSFPNQKPEKIKEIPANLLQGLSIKPQEVLMNKQAYFAIYDNEQDVRLISQNSDLLKTLAPYDVVVTAPSHSQDIDFISRYFWPANGGDEDPVTGSIHTGLAPFWAERLGKNSLQAYQASSRGGYVHCEVKANKVIITGNAVQYLSGFIEVTDDQIHT